jgi:inhibitor of KinA sporulation pathway (predicted exonuclease)
VVTGQGFWYAQGIGLSTLWEPVVAIKRDKVVIVDIEATCWEGDPPAGQQREIIEVGVCLLDVRSNKLSDPLSILVRPTRSTVSDFCTELTSLTQQQVDEGVAFDTACRLLEMNYNSRNRLWTSWGNYDFYKFRKQCKERGVRYPFSKKHMNLKRLFADHYKTHVSLSKALELTGLDLEGTWHRGVDDAWNSGRLLQLMLRTFGDKILLRHW